MGERIVSLADRREIERRKRFGVDANETALPLALLVDRVLDDARLRMASLRNREAQSR